MPMKSAFLFSIGIHMAFLGYYYDFTSLLQSRGVSSSYNLSLDLVLARPTVSAQSLPKAQLVAKPVDKTGLAIKKSIKQTEALNKKVSPLNKVNQELGGPIAGRGGISRASAKDIYIQKVRAAIRKNQFYPSLAKRLGHEGVVKARFTVSPEGKIINILELNSEHSSLSQAVEELLVTKLQLPTFPKEMMDLPSLELTVPVRFRSVD